MSTSFVVPSFLAGLSTGLRTMTVLAVTLAADESPWAGLAGTLAAGEAVGDKLPMTPARTAPIGLFGRVAVGALCGSLVARRRGESRATGAAVAVIGAVAASYGGYYLRASAGQKLGLPDPIVALAEDGIAFGLARLANA